MKEKCEKKVAILIAKITCVVVFLTNSKSSSLHRHVFFFQRLLSYKLSSFQGGTLGETPKYFWKQILARDEDGDKLSTKKKSTHN